MKKHDIYKKLDDKVKSTERNKKAVESELVNDIDKKLNDDEKIEIMTQFMLDPTSSATKLLEKRREMYELQEALQRDKEKFIGKEEQFKKTEEELRMRDEEFHKKIVDYFKNTFEKRSNEKSTHEQRKAAEMLLQTQLDTDISNLEISNKKLKKDLEKMKEIYSSLKGYDDFLKEVKKSQPDYNDVTEIISKYKTLEITLNDLENTGKEMNIKKDEERIKFKHQKAEYDNKIQSIENEISDIQNKLKEQKSKKKQLENEVNNFEKNSNNISSSLEQILLAIENIYNKCIDNPWTKHEIEDQYKGSNLDTNYRVNKAKEMLKKINNYMEDYKDIEEKCREALN